MQRENSEALAEKQKEQQERYNIDDGRMVTTTDFNEKLLGLYLRSIKVIVTEIA